jgi:endonuclease YncB( thermonuclease family)
MAAPAAAVTLSGAARAVDGDTLVVSGERVRLLGIDAPELDQTCALDGKAWACGAWARAALRDLVRGSDVVCSTDGRDRFDRLIGRCRIGDRDLGGTLVRNGAAFAYVRYSTAYVPEQELARAEGRGLWAAVVESPEAFRHPEPSEGQSPAGACDIKGNISKGGHIYHRPGQNDYANTRIDPSRGERWFCSEAEARAAGWRAARR